MKPMPREMAESMRWREGKREASLSSRKGSGGSEAKTEITVTRRAEPQQLRGTKTAPVSEVIPVLNHFFMQY